MKKMTNGERLVWAASFVEHLGDAYRKNQMNDQEHEEASVCEAVELADIAVDLLSTHRKAVLDSQGKDSTAYRRLLEMLK